MLAQVQGFTYGVGYKAALGWVAENALFEVTDAKLNGLSHRVVLHPFDVAENKGVQGVRISLSDNSRDIYVAFRHTTLMKHAGVYATLWKRRLTEGRPLNYVLI